MYGVGFMKPANLLLLFAMLFVSALASGQDWRDCKPEGDYSFNNVKTGVRRVMTGMYFGSDEKAFSRSGDFVAVVILQTLDDSEMAAPGGAKNVLNILHDAFPCPGYCVKPIDERRPRVTLVLLEHLRELTHGTMNRDIDDAKKFILEQTRKVASIAPDVPSARQTNSAHLR
jgi:hypothetical protein